MWDPKTLIRKGRERHLFLFEMSLVFSKEVKDSSGRSKYIYKSKLFVSLRDCNYNKMHPSLVIDDEQMGSDVAMMHTESIKTALPSLS